MTSKRIASRLGLLALIALVAVLAQQALAVHLGRWLAGVWVGTVELMLRLLGPLFGG